MEGLRFDGCVVVALGNLCICDPETAEGKRRTFRDVIRLLRSRRGRTPFGTPQFLSERAGLNSLSPCVEWPITRYGCLHQE